MRATDNFDPDNFDMDALRLARAFYKVKNPEARGIIVAIVEAVADGASVDFEKFLVVGVHTELRLQSENNSIDELTRPH